MKIKDIVNSRTALGIAIGIGASVAASALIPALPALARAVRPTARVAVKSGLVFLERSREIMSEAKEELEDIVAEVKAELQQAAQAQQTDMPVEDEKTENQGK